MSSGFSVLLEKQRKFFSAGNTRSYDFRVQQLYLLREAILKHEKNICEALRADLNKAPAESYMTEIGPALAELRLH
jgi:aldehyde dehydrogenase (NAD+)